LPGRLAVELRRLGARQRPLEELRVERPPREGRGLLEVDRVPRLGVVDRQDDLALLEDALVVGAGLGLRGVGLVGPAGGRREREAVRRRLLAAGDQQRAGDQEDGCDPDGEDPQRP
jgi:hypothetical protein